MEHFGNLPDGTKVHRIVISGGGLTASFLTYGAILQNLQLEGHASPLVLGFPEFPNYLNDSPYFGATAGRFANRIRDGHLQLDDNVFQLDQNFMGKHCLHGGNLGVGKRNWEVIQYGGHFVCMKIALQDGEMGFPGNMIVEANFQLLLSGTLDITYTATTDSPTLCNLTHHSYFNLSGEHDVRQHVLQVDANHFLPVNNELIPTGEVKPTTDHDFDFRAAKSLASVTKNHLIDHNFCLSDSKILKQVATLYSPKSDIKMICKTTEPGLQIYAGSKVNTNNPGLQGTKMGAYAGLAMEAQLWPDANHHEHFPSAILTPEKTYYHNTQYIFSKANDTHEQ
jgi:aldose 1-epimerase